MLVFYLMATFLFEWMELYNAEAINSHTKNDEEQVETITISYIYIYGEF